MDATAIGLLVFLHTMTDGTASSNIACWQHSGRDVLGNPEILAEAEYGLTHEGIDPNCGGKLLRTQRLPLDGNWLQVLERHGVPRQTTARLARHYRADTVKDLLAPPLVTAEYRLWVRVSDASGNWSSWSASTTPVLVVDVIPPEPPIAVDYLP